MILHTTYHNFTIKYSPGKDSLEADCLSRNPVLEAYENEDEQLKIVNLIKLDNIIEDQQNNKNLQDRKNKMILRNNVYYKKVKTKEKIILSEDFSIKLIVQIHKDYCHIGMKQLQNKIIPFYTANNLIQNIKKHARTVKYA